MVEINLLGLLYCTHAAAAPPARRGGRGEPRRVADMVNVSSVAGRVARLGSGVYNATKFGVVAFSESLRQEVTASPRAGVDDRARRGDDRAGRPQPARGPRGHPVHASASIELMRAEDIAESIVFTVTRPRHVAVNEVLVRPTEQER